AFSFAHFINADGGAEITRAYAREFKPSPWLATPQASAAVFVVCAESHDEAERLAQSRDLFIARLYTGRGGRYPTVAEAEAHEYTPWERQIVEHVRGRKTGRVYAAPVNLLEIGGRRFLVAPRGRTQWMRNAEAAGEVVLKRGSSRRRFRIRAVPNENKPEILKTYLDRFKLAVQRY